MLDPVLLHEKGWVFSLPGFLEQALCENLVQHLTQLAPVPSKAYHLEAGHHQDLKLRQSRELKPDAFWQRQIFTLLSSQRAVLEAFFHKKLSYLEPLQFLKYQSADYFRAHQDRNAKLAAAGGIHSRQISILIYLNQYLLPGEHMEDGAVSSYQGGELVFYFPQGNSQRGVPLRVTPGLLLAFPSDLWHEVRPITAGERFSVVSWFH